MIKQRIIRERPASVLAHIHSNTVIHVYLGVYIRPEIDLNARTKVYICNNRKTRAKTWHHCKSIFAIYIYMLFDASKVYGTRQWTYDTKESAIQDVTDKLELPIKTSFVFLLWTTDVHS